MIPKSLILIRGLPGSGKSTLADVLSEQGKYPVLSIDSYFVNPSTGVYTFIYENNHLAYKKCEQMTEKALENSIEKVFVDNAFTLEWEMEPYFKLAAKYAYTIFVVTVENRHGGDNIHQVTKEQLEKMAAKYKVQLLPD